MSTSRITAFALVAAALAGCGRAARSGDATSPEASDSDASDASAPDADAAREAVEIAGSVTDEFGVPAVGVDVTWTSDDRATTRAARSGADGGFRFGDVPAERVGAVRLAPGHSDVGDPQLARAGTHGLHVVLARPRTTITGRLVDDGDAPARRWLLFVAADPPLAPFVPQMKGSAPVLADGAFTISAARGVEYDVSLAAGDHEIPLGRLAAGARDAELRAPKTR